MIFVNEFNTECRGWSRVVIFSWFQYASARCEMLPKRGPPKWLMTSKMFPKKEPFLFEKGRFSMSGIALTPGGMQAQVLLGISPEKMGG